MTRTEWVEQIARERVVEQIARNIAGSGDLIDDLTQTVYEALLTYREESIVSMCERGEIRFFIARLVLNQYRSRTSPFFMRHRRFSYDSDPIDTAGNVTAYPPDAQRHSTRAERHKTVADLRWAVKHWQDSRDDDTDEGVDIRHRIAQLSLVERTMLIVYAETGSLRQTARFFGVGKNTIRNRIIEIRKAL